MKFSIRYALAIVPLLSIMALAPHKLMTPNPSRGIASVVVVKEATQEEFKKFKEYSSKVDPKSLVRNDHLTLEDLKKQEEELKHKLTEVKVDDKDVDLQKNREGLVIDLLLIEDGVLALNEKKLLEASEKESLEKSILEHKAQIEILLLDLEKNQQVVADKEEPKKEEVKEETKAEVKDEVKTEVAVDTKEEPKKEESKPEEPKKEVCEAEEKNALLTKQIEQLLNDQKQIMQTMLGMAQMMVSMHQQNQQQMPNPYYANSWHSSPYQYNQPQTAGNWVYYPQGFRPNQENIFAQPQMPQMQQPQGQGFYPDQVHMNGNWNLAPQYNFQADPRYTVQPVMPGNFGAEAFSYNLSNQGPSNPMPMNMMM